MAEVAEETKNHCKEVVKIDLSIVPNRLVDFINATLGFQKSNVAFLYFQRCVSFIQVLSSKLANSKLTFRMYSSRFLQNNTTYSSRFLQKK